MAIDLACMAVDGAREKLNIAQTPFSIFDGFCLNASDNLSDTGLSLG